MERPMMFVCTGAHKCIQTELHRYGAVLKSAAILRSLFYNNLDLYMQRIDTMIHHRSFSTRPDPYCALLRNPLATKHRLRHHTLPPPLPLPRGQLTMNIEFVSIELLITISALCVLYFLLFEFYVWGISVVNYPNCLDYGSLITSMRQLDHLFIFGTVTKLRRLEQNKDIYATIILAIASINCSLLHEEYLLFLIVLHSLYLIGNY
ncbi:hypothetical protein IEQ34_005716 [Dendrobium chrysotoxum]|uniref:Uncharacterized protein n=1 Tax=Dendrobium chrysotoxum TaxID=161865 RepID=A0AAV7HC70_DENCH|nr:hypothetical protein IEQ34_005716 [Dendrobium chrysotoxum]